MQAQSPNGLPVRYVGRGTKFGNPFNLRDAVAEAAKDLSQQTRERRLVGHESTTHWIPYAHAILVNKYRDYVKDNPELICAIKEQLKDKNLACFCDLSVSCHVDVIFEVLDGEFD